MQCSSPTPLRWLFAKKTRQFRTSVAKQSIVDYQDSFLVLDLLLWHITLHTFTLSELHYTNNCYKGCLAFTGSCSVLFCLVVQLSLKELILLQKKRPCISDVVYHHVQGFFKHIIAQWCRYGFFNLFPLYINVIILL